MSPGEQVTLSATAVDWGSMEDEPQMNTLDALERRMGHTSRGLSQLHHLLEYLLSKMVDGAAESRRHTQVLCRKLIKNHMETYTALATLRAVLTDLSKDPENCLHSLEQIVGYESCVCVIFFFFWEVVGFADIVRHVLSSFFPPAFPHSNDW